MQPSGYLVKIFNGTGPFEDEYFADVNETAQTSSFKFLYATLHTNDSIHGNQIFELDLCTLNMGISINVFEAEYFAAPTVNGTGVCRPEKAMMSLPSPTDSPSSSPTQFPSLAPSHSHEGTKSPKGCKASKATKTTKAPSSSSKGKGYAYDESCSYYEYSCNTTSKSPKTGKRGRMRRIQEEPTSKATKAPKASIAPVVPTVETSPPINAPTESPKTCEECNKLMEEEVPSPEVSESTEIFYIVKIITMNDDITVPDSNVEKMLLDVLNGFFKAELLGCNFGTSSSRRRLESEIALHTADFDELTIGEGNTDGKFT